MNPARLDELEALLANYLDGVPALGGRDDGGLNLAVSAGLGREHSLSSFEGHALEATWD